MEDAADQWVPPGSDLRAQGPLVSGRREGRGAGMGGGDWAAAATWAREKKKGGKVLGLRAKNREGEFFSFFLFPFSFKTNLFKTFSKPNLNPFLIFSQNHSSQSIKCRGMHAQTSC